MSVCMHMCVQKPRRHRNQISLELELQAMVMCVLGTEFGILQEQHMLLITKTPL